MNIVGQLQPQPVAVRYAATIGLMAICGGITLALRSQTGSPGLFILLPGIFISTLLYGRGASFVATLIGLGFAFYNIWSMQSIIDSSVPTVLFAGMAALVSVAGDTLRENMIRAREAEKAKTVLLMELAHRTKNNLAMLSAMMRLQARRQDVNASEALEQMSARIQVMAQVYDHLTIRADTKLVDAKQYLTEIVQHLLASISGASPVAITSEADELYIHSELAVPIAIIVNELITNSLKYAFPDGRAGHIHVELRAAEDVALTVRDNGIGRSDTTSDGVGSRIISLLTQQLGGTLTYKASEEGTRAELRIPRPLAS